jgi:hypothetical protein
MGEWVNLTTFPTRPYHIPHYIDMYCEAGMEKMRSQVPIRKIENLGLRVVLYLIGHNIISVALHQASHDQMNYAMHCLQPVIFD